MKKHITITRQDAEQKSVSAVIGEAIVGRALIPNCRDERVSRRHGFITVSNEGKVVLISKERMYYIAVGQAKRRLLHKGATLVLSDGDRFSFLPQKFCFQIKISDVLKDEERKRKSKDVLESESIVKGQCSEEDITSEEPKRMKILDSTKPQPSTSTGDDDDQHEIKQKQENIIEREDSDTNVQGEDEGIVQEQYIEDVIPETREKIRISSFKEAAGTEKSRPSGSTGEEDAQEEQTAEEKPGEVEEKNAINQEQRGYDEEEADLYPETGVPSNKHKTNTAEENEGKDRQNEANEPKTSAHYVFGPSSYLKPLEEFWSRGILSAPINSGEPKVDKPRYPEENMFQEDDYRPLCPHGKTCFNLTPKHRQDFRHDVPEPQTKSNPSSKSD